MKVALLSEDAGGLNFIHTHNGVATMSAIPKDVVLMTLELKTSFQAYSRLIQNNEQAFHALEPNNNI